MTSGTEKSVGFTEKRERERTLHEKCQISEFLWVPAFMSNNIYRANFHICLKMDQQKIQTNKMSIFRHFLIRELLKEK